MSVRVRVVLVVMGGLVGALAAAQLILGRVLLTGTADIGTRVAHEHLGYTLVALTLAYVIVTTWVLLRLPSANQR